MMLGVLDDLNYFDCLEFGLFEFGFVYCAVLAFMEGVWLLNLLSF